MVFWPETVDGRFSSVWNNPAGNSRRPFFPSETIWPETVDGILHPVKMVWLKILHNPKNCRVNPFKIFRTSYCKEKTAGRSAEKNGRKKYCCQQPFFLQFSVYVLYLFFIKKLFVTTGLSVSVGWEGNPDLSIFIYPFSQCMERNAQWECTVNRKWIYSWFQ